MNKRSWEKPLNKLAFDITGFDIAGIEDCKTKTQAIDHHLKWLNNYFVETIQHFEKETKRFADGRLRTKWLN